MRQVEAQRRVEDLQHAARQQARRTAAKLLHKVQHRVEAGQLVERGTGEGRLQKVRHVLGWKFMSCSHCQELGQQASWLVIGCTRVNNSNQKPGQQVDPALDFDSNS